MRTPLTYLSILLTTCIPMLAWGKKPNIILIVADDMGYSDIGCYGSEIKTPTIDALAANGVRFSQFYNSTRCCPTRASLLTGLYPHQAGIGHMTEDRKIPSYQGTLTRNSLTIPELLKQNGYATGMTGKWHLIQGNKLDPNHRNWPNNRGFEYFFGTIPGHGSQWAPKGLFLNQTPIAPKKGFFYTDAIAEHAIKFIDQSIGKKKPFFLYMPFTAPHYPLHAREKTINSYETTYRVGWDVIRKNRMQRLRSSGLLPKETSLSPRDPASLPWSEEPHKRWQSHRMQVYAAMVDEMDQAIARVINRLKKKNQYSNTLIVFISDNGGSNEGHLNNTIERLNKPWKSSMFPEKTHDGHPVMPGDFPNLFLGPENTYGSYGIKWANVSNTPFRRHKSWLHEGGISSPAIIHWPDKIKSPAISHAPAHVIDILPTFLAASGTSYPDENPAEAIQKTEGLNLLSNDPDSPRGIGWEHEGNRAFRLGKWKIVSEYPGSWKSFYPYKKQGRWELYNMETDRTELNDLSTTHPKILKKLTAGYKQWAEHAGVIPWKTLEKNHPVQSIQ